MSLSITYVLNEHGWAEAHLGNGACVQTATVSYLHNTVENTVEAALSLLINPLTPQCIVFMDEPGEFQLILTPATDGVIDVVLRWYDDWQSWDMHPEAQFDVVWKTTTNAVEFAWVIKAMLDNLWVKYGAEQYKERWIEHEFPIKLHETLNRILVE